MAYPEKLPLPVRSGYNGSYLAPQKGTKMDDGSVRTRRTGVSNSKVLNLTWVLTGAQRKLFDSWMRFENLFGQNWVEIPALGVDGVIKVRSIDGTPRRNSKETDQWEVSGRFIHKMPKFLVPPRGALPVWPEALPHPEAADMSLTSIDPSITSNINAQAMPATRQRFYTVWTEVTIGIICTMAERDAYNDFYYNTLIGGDCWFNMPLGGPHDPTLTRVKVRGEPVESPFGGIFKINFTVITDTFPEMSRSEYYALVGQGPYADDYFAEDYTEE